MTAVLRLFYGEGRLFRYCDTGLLFGVLEYGMHGDGSNRAGYTAYYGYCSFPPFPFIFFLFWLFRVFNGGGFYGMGLRSMVYRLVAVF